MTVMILQYIDINDYGGSDILHPCNTCNIPISIVSCKKIR